MLEIAIEADGEWDSSRSWEPLVRRAAEAAIAESAFPQLAASDRQVEISIVLTGDRQVSDLNAEYRGKPKPTNVLSFPMADADELRRTNVAGPELLLGDVVLASGVCASEAAAKGLTLEQHATHLLIHGTLHLLGHDHHE